MAAYHFFVVLVKFLRFLKTIGELYIDIMSFTMTACQHKDKFSHLTGFLASDSSVILSVQLFTEVDVAH